MKRLTALVFSILLVLVLYASTSSTGAQAADRAGVSAAPLVLRQSTQPIDQHDDSRVGVQLVVAGIAAGVVVGIGTAAYFVRRRLGLTAYTPDQAAGGHH